MRWVASCKFIIDTKCRNLQIMCSVLIIQSTSETSVLIYIHMQAINDVALCFVNIYIPLYLICFKLYDIVLISVV